MNACRWDGYDEGLLLAPQCVPWGLTIFRNQAFSDLVGSVTAITQMKNVMQMKNDQYHNI